MRKKRAEDSVKTHEFPFAFHDEANHTHFFLVSPLRHTQKKQYQALQRILTKKPTIQVSSCLSTPQKKTRSDNILNRRNLRSCTIDDDSFLSALPFFSWKSRIAVFRFTKSKIDQRKKSCPHSKMVPEPTTTTLHRRGDPAAACIFFFL